MKLNNECRTTLDSPDCCDWFGHSYSEKEAEKKKGQK